MKRYSITPMEIKFRRAWNPYANVVCSESKRKSHFSALGLGKPGEIEVLKFEIDTKTWTCLTNQRLVGFIQGKFSEFTLDTEIESIEYLDSNFHIVANKSQFERIKFIKIEPGNTIFYAACAKAFALANVVTHLVGEP